MRGVGFLSLVPLFIAGCVPAEADPQTAPEVSSTDGTVVVSQDMPALPGLEMSASDEAACKASGGTVDRRGMVQAEMCVTPFADAGKSCTDGDQCEGRCIAEGQVGSGPDEVVTGICERDDRTFGCFGIVEDGKVEAGLCVD